MAQDFEAKQLEQKNKESIQATQEMLPCQEDAPNDSLNNQQCELIDPLVSLVTYMCFYKFSFNLSIFLGVSV